MNREGNLKNLVLRFQNGNKNSYKDGKYRISKGGYDLLFEIYYDEIAIIENVDRDINIISYNSKENLKDLQTVKNIINN